MKQGAREYGPSYPQKNVGGRNVRKDSLPLGFAVENATSIENQFLQDDQGNKPQQYSEFEDPDSSSDEQEEDFDAQEYYNKQMKYQKGQQPGI